MKRELAGLLAGVSLLLCACGSSGGSASLAKSREVRYGPINTDGDALVISDDNTVRTISADAEKVIHTQDGKYVTLLEKDGVLTVYAGEEKKYEDTSVDTIKSMTEDMLLFSKGNDYKPSSVVEAPAATEAAAPGEDSGATEKKQDYVVGRYTFSDGQIFSVKNPNDLLGSDKGSALLYYQTSDSGKSSLFLVKPNSSESELVTSTSRSISLVGVNSSGTICAWLETEEKEHTLYFYANGEKEKVLTCEDSYMRYYMSFNEAEDMAILRSYVNNEIAIWTQADGIQKVKLPDPTSYMLFTEQGSFRNIPNVTPKTFYVGTSLDLYLYNLYAVGTDGSREKLASNITDAEVCQGQLYYIKEDGTLYTGKLSDSKLSEETRIADGVCDMVVSPNGKMVVYARDGGSDQLAAIYCYTVGQNKPVRITPEGYCSYTHYKYIEYDSYNMPAYFSADGKSIYYFNDPYQVDDSGTYTTTLMQYTISKEESTRIASDVLPQLDATYNRGYVVDSNAIRYKRFVENDEELGNIYDFVLWNGKENTVLARDLKG